MAKTAPRPDGEHPRRRTGSEPEERGGRRRRKPRKSTPMTVLFGITCAFVAGTLLFLGVLLIQNRPFEKVPEVDMPNLVGQAYDEVTKNREYSHFEFEIESQEFNTQYPKGVIFQQYPTPGKRVKEGITIKVKVSTGAQTVTLPDFADQEATLVYAKLTEMGLQYTFEEEFSDTIAEGNVIRTAPGRNESVAAGSTVTVTVSKGSGKPKTVVPDLLGEDIEYARELVRDAGLIISEKYEASIMEPGVVLSQAPNYPARVDEGSTVYVTVSSDEVIETQQTSILILMPQSIDEDMVLTVIQDGAEVHRETVVPSRQRSIKVPLTGEGRSTVEVYLGGRLLQANDVNFDDGTSPKTVDNLSDFE